MCCQLAIAQAIAQANRDAAEVAPDLDQGL